ncbi:CRISPR-associated autoregulator, DevR family [Ferroglobus placidus DSM 10642]|uniref:CRISPR-associated autoregulator, DevR family n=1 Tax=Ferroglobus placidus (strain DSM 10642 / AEDII12DO) TaxID=589924 RepID=D3RZU4_FERPA|nr:type I-A CRISPR-associated protein Cas7/Csa2 [Ferroglobus placidus]ADC66007.1 CRISPR-associated autoregulator, DevR family [Ferroglobus placidus DSM 10642]
MFVRFSGRLLINVASLNTQGASGTNFIEITKVPVVLERNGELVVEEVPAISGNMLKHYHFVHLVDLLKNSKYNKNKLSEYDLRYVAYRFREKIKNETNIGNENADLNNEEDIIKKFATADIHGYLAPAIPNRRESLVKFSFAIPCEESIEKAVEISSVTQNRVVIDEKGKIEGSGEESGTAMMVFKRQYVSALYGFSSTFDAYYVGRPQSNPRQIAVQNEERKERAKLSVLAYINLLSGISGANTSRGLPALEVRELVAATSQSPIPMAKHGFYKDYIEETIKILNDFSKAFDTNVTVHVYTKDKRNINKPQDNDLLELRQYDSFVKLIESVAEEVTNGLSTE